MKKVIENYPAEVYISAAELERANLNEWERLELHLLDQAAVVIPGVMTVMELVRTAEALQELASNLLTALGTACEKRRLPGRAALRFDKGAEPPLGYASRPCSGGIRARHRLQARLHS